MNILVINQLKDALEQPNAIISGLAAHLKQDYLAIIDWSGYDCYTNNNISAMNTLPLTVIDFFSGAGGFSEGFRQQGFKVVKGVDYWEPAVITHNLNHGLDDKPENVLDYSGNNSGDVERIEALEDVDVIIGSPSCVTFSLSNKGGKADKTEGIRLIETYLRIIAVKKHKPNSRLKAWLMENVPNSGNYIKHEYTFSDLNLRDWAESNRLEPNEVALSLNGVVLNACDFGAPQNRKRFICGEIVVDGSFPTPTPTTSSMPTLRDIRSKMPPPNSTIASGLWRDPNYPSLRLGIDEISDHFYDSGLYINQWEQAKYLKTMHPFMGKMSFPENPDKPSRTITATRSACTRESLIYTSEFEHSGHGEYRTPTVREAATLMGFPYTYQFFGSEGVKWKQIGNSVSPQLSSALASSILNKLGCETTPLEKVSFAQQTGLHNKVNNLNEFAPRTFNDSNPRKPEARFRRSVCKGRNTTVDLLNYLPGKSARNGWYVCVFYGTGTYQYDVISVDHLHNIKAELSKQFSYLDEFTSEILDHIDINSIKHDQLQYEYVYDTKLASPGNPLVIINTVKMVVDKYASRAESESIKLTGLIRKDFSLVHALFMFVLPYVIYRGNTESEDFIINERMPLYEF
jgi:DNA (cytosine-5)-methyltransferase 1